MPTIDNGSGQGPAATAGPGETRNDSTTFANASRPSPPAWTLISIAAGALVIIATYLAVVLTQPKTLGQDLGSTTLWVMIGYLAGAALIAAGTLPRIPRSMIALLPVAIALNVLVGQIVGVYTPIPLYLDSLGSVVIGVLAGPAAGALTGVLSSAIWGVTMNPTVIVFTSGAAFVGAAAGWAARIGAFRRVWTAIIAGLVVGVPSGAIGAPVAAFIYGGGLGVGTGGVVATLQAAGLEMLNATTVQSLASDTVDKALIFALAFLVVRGLPRRLTDRYRFAEHSLSPRARQ